MVTNSARKHVKTPNPALKSGLGERCVPADQQAPPGPRAVRGRLGSEEAAPPTDRGSGALARRRRGP